MEELLNSLTVIEIENDEYSLDFDINKLKELLKNNLEQISFNLENKYVPGLEEDLTTSIILRIVSEMFIKKINMEDNEPYIINFTIDESKYRISISKITIKNESKYMYGLIMG